MTFSQGMASPSIDEARQFSLRSKLHLHREGLIFQPEGFGFIMGRENIKADGDYTPLAFEAQTTQIANAGATVIYVNDVWGFAYGQPIEIAGNINTIMDVDYDESSLTLYSGLPEQLPSGSTVSMDRVRVFYDAQTGKTTVWFVISGHVSIPECAGADFQSGIGWAGPWEQNDPYETLDPLTDRGFERFDTCCGRVLVPIWVGFWYFYPGPYMCRGQRAVDRQPWLEIDARESASAVDPNYVLQIEFWSHVQSPHPKEVAINLKTWRGL